MENKVVVHLLNGRIHKGITHDFDPDGENFHLLPAEGGGIPMRLSIEDMKALFYVKDYLGNSDFVSRRRFDASPGGGRKVIVTFSDGEVVYGTTGPSEERRRGFFMEPADPDDNNSKIFVVRSSVKNLQFPS
jgi:hypothetical protein